MADDGLHYKALLQCAVDLKNKLTPDTIVAHLQSDNLLTEIEVYKLTGDLSKSRPEKVQIIINILPTKGSGWWDKFIDSLRKTAGGTAHEELANILEQQLDKVIGKGKCVDKCLDFIAHSYCVYNYCQEYIIETNSVKC